MVAPYLTFFFNRFLDFLINPILLAALFVLLAALFVLMFEAGVDIVKYVLYLG